MTQAEAEPIIREIDATIRALLGLRALLAPQADELAAKRAERNGDPGPVAA